jgi:hypothetical protein
MIIGMPKRSISVQYDVGSDILRVSIDEPAASYDDDDDLGFSHNLSQAEGKPIGVTITGFLSNWRSTRELAYGRISSFLRVDIAVVRRAVIPTLLAWSV